MPSRPSGGVQWVRAVMYGLGDIKEWSNDFWFSVTSGSIDATTAFHTISTAIFNALSPGYLDYMAASWLLRGVNVEYNNGSGTFSDSYYDTTSPTISFDALPEDTAVIVRKRTADPSPSGKGRWYFSGITESQTTGSYLNATGITNMQAFAVILKTAITAGGLTLSPAHFSPTTGLLYPIVDTPVVGLMGTRRRRRGPF